MIKLIKMNFRGNYLRLAIAERVNMLKMHRKMQKAVEYLSQNLKP